MMSVIETTSAFAKILAAYGKSPRSITVDQGPEFKANSFQEVCKRNEISLQYKDAEDLNGGLARLDNAIDQIKKASRRLQEIKGGTWLTHIAHATDSYDIESSINMQI
jgi:hypothetical protein